MKKLIIGDVHGCWKQLQALLTKAPGYIPVFVGDLFDRGPSHDELIPWVLEHKPLACRGNHDWKLLRWLRGNPVKPTHGLNVTIESLNRNPAWKAPLREYLESLPLWLELHEEGEPTCWVIHAAANPKDLKNFHLLTRAGQERLRANCTWGLIDEYVEDEKPIRKPFAHLWEGLTHDRCVHGHTPVTGNIEWGGPTQNVLNIDTGCVFGGRLTGVTYPDFQLLQVDSDFNFESQP